MLTDSTSLVLLQRLMALSQQCVIVLSVRKDSADLLADLELKALNGLAEQALGVVFDTVSGQSFARLCPYLCEGDSVNRYRQAISTGESVRFEQYCQLPDQPSPAWLNIVVTPLKNYLLLSFSDRHSAGSRTQTTWLDTIESLAFEESSSGVTVLEAMLDKQGQVEDFRFVLINPAGLRMSGYKRHELLGRTLWEIYPATGINGLFHEYVRVYESGHTVDKENYYPEYGVWRAVKIQRVERGIMLTYTDITLNKNAEEIARQQARLLKTVMAGLPVGVAVLSPVCSSSALDAKVTDFTVITVNPLMEQIIGKSATQVGGQSLALVFNEVTGFDLLSGCMACVELGQEQAFEMPYRYAFYSVTIRSQGDQLLLTMSDITTLGRTQPANNQQR